MRKLRILHTSLTYQPKLDGVAQVVKNISERLVARGHEVHVATTRFKQLSEESINGVVVHRFDIGPEETKHLDQEIQKYKQLLSAGNWDVIAAHAAACWPTNILLETLARIRARLVFVPHGLHFWNAPRQRREYQRLGDALRSFHATTALSELLVETEFYEKFSLSPPIVIPNGVDLSEFEKPTLGMRYRWRIGERPWLINVSNHSRVQKGHEYLHRLANALAEDGAIVTNIGNSFPVARYHLGRLGMKGGCYYECRAKTLLGSKLQLQTGVHRSEICSALKEGAIFVLTSSFEASPIVILEAMAAGLPWVSFDVGNVREHKGGYVVRDLDDMVQKIRFLLCHPEERRALGDAGRKCVLEKHNWDQIVDQYERLYLNSG